MEICYLNYEIIHGEFAEEKSDVCPSKTYGRSIYNPTENSIEFYDMQDNFIFSKKLSTITLIVNFLKENKLSFRQNNDLIKIHYDKKDSIEAKSFSFLQSKIFRELNSKRKEEQIETK